MAKRGSTSGDILIDALEDLTEPDFKRFKDKLSDIDFKGQRNIPQKTLEDADRIDTKNLLENYYASDSAIDVTIEVFSEVNLMEQAARLRGKRQRVLDPHEAREVPGATSDGDVNESKLQIVHFGANGERTLEAPSEVQAFHAVQRKPTFSSVSVSKRSKRRRMKIRGQALLYRAIDNADITLHLYLIPDEKHIEQTLARYTRGKKKIEKPSRAGPLYFGHSYTVESQPNSEIHPKRQQFEEIRKGVTPHFWEIYTKALLTENVHISLKDENGEPVWGVTVRPVDVDLKLKELLRTPELFFQKHRESLINRMGNIEPIMDILKTEGILNEEELQCVCAGGTSCSKNRELIEMVMRKGTESQRQFLLALRETDLPLYNDLE